MFDVAMFRFSAVRVLEIDTDEDNRRSTARGLDDGVHRYLGIGRRGKFKRLSFRGASVTWRACAQANTKVSRRLRYQWRILRNVIVRLGRACHRRFGARVRAT
jgi:hypothetical protein